MGKPPQGRAIRFWLRGIYRFLVEVSRISGDSFTSQEVDFFIYLVRLLRTLQAEYQVVFQGALWCHSSVQLLSHVRLFATPWTTARQAFPSMTNTWSWDCWHFFLMLLSVYCQFSSGQSLSHVRLFATPWIAARQASLYITHSQGSPKIYIFLCEFFW